jgi:glycine betaine/proline transport system substrate-binding protein
MLLLLAIVLALSIALVACEEEEEDGEATATPAATATPTPTPAAKETIVLSELNWASSQFQTEVAKIMIAEGYGYPVDSVPAATIPTLEAMIAGDIDVIFEIWYENQQQAWDSAVADGDVVSLGTMNDDNWQSCFVVPTYVIEGDTERGIDPTAPNLAAASDLEQAEYVALFGDPEDPGKGRIVTCVAGWECEGINAQKVAAYGLDDDYNLLVPGSQDALFASLEGAYEQGEPWLGYLWGPTIIAGKLDLTVLEEPPYDAAVWEDNKGCAYPSVQLLVGARTDFESRAPDAAAMLKNWVMDTDTLSEALAYMDAVDGEPYDAAVWFLQNRESIWTEYVPADVAESIREAAAAL